MGIQDIMKTVGTRRTFYAGLAAALLLTSSLTAVSVAVSRGALADTAAENAAVDAFFQRGYGVCDADVLSRFWQIEFWDAKVRAGEMLQRGELRLLSDKLSYGYRDHSCGESSSLGYEDAPALAALWTAPTQA